MLGGLLDASRHARIFIARALAVLPGVGDKLDHGDFCAGRQRINFTVNVLDGGEIALAHHEFNHAVQAHLPAADGTRQVADGLGYSADQWQPGDWFAQRHAFTAPGDTLETGLYNYVTLERAGPMSTLSAD